MHREVNAISGRLSLRAPQRESLEILDRLTEIVPFKEKPDVETALSIIQQEYPSVTNFERDFPSLCFALATGVGKTRLMGAFIAYLHRVHGIDDFFVLAPNLTIYNKLIADFTPGTPKYVFPGIAEFATNPPAIITGDNYQSSAGTLFDILVRCKINIFNISKINTEFRKGASPRIKRLSEYLGESYFDYLANRPNLVLLMDESHRYRADAGVRAISELKPILGLELTATPYVQTTTRPIPLKNVIFDYSLRRAMDDGFVKEPAVATRKDFDPASMSPGELERLKLEDGIRLHEQTKVQLETYARENECEIYKPFVLVIARDTTHAAELVDLIKSDEFFGGAYKEKVIQVDSSTGGTEKDEIVERLLKVEQRDEPTEIVVHVNMLKEGWDVKNLYTIVPLRAAKARVLIEQTIGRGLRLPYGKRTGVEAIDTLSIVAHDRFQEIVEEARRPDSSIQMRTIILDPETLATKTRTVVVRPLIESILGIGVEGGGGGETACSILEFTRPQDVEAARFTYDAIKKLQRQPDLVQDISDLQRPDVQERLVAEVRAQYNAGQLGIAAITEAVDFADVVARTTSRVVGQNISMPKITVLPVGEVRSGFHSFTLDLTSLTQQPGTTDLWTQSLRTGDGHLVGLTRVGAREVRLEDYVVTPLIDFDDISYDNSAGQLYDLAGQVVDHYRTYLAEEDVARVLQENQRSIAVLVHSQMQAHLWEDDVPYETKVNAGFSELRPSAYTQASADLDFRSPPVDRRNIDQLMFGGFQRCLYRLAKFQSDKERLLAVILDRDSEKWFRPAKGQFNITYKLGHERPLYQPDFVAELADYIAMIEVKAANQMNDPEVLAKQDAGVVYCRLATEYNAGHGKKPWRYVLVPHDAIAENWGLQDLLSKWEVKP